MLHADINKDGTVDPVEAVVSEHSIIRPVGHRVSDADPNENHCYAWVTTGTPPTHALFNESICQVISMCMYVCISVWVCECVGVCACMRASVCVCVRACACG
jgi:hypothetical protein